MIGGGILAGAGLNPLLTPSRMKDMTGQLPLAIAQLLISPRIHEQRRRYGDDTSSAPAHTSLAFGSQQDPILILRHTARGASCAFPVSVLLFPPRGQPLNPRWRPSAWGSSLGGLLVRLFPANRWASGG